MIDRKPKSSVGPLRVLAIALIDLVAAGLILLVFAYFHHVMPRAGTGGMQSTNATLAPLSTPRTKPTTLPGSSANSHATATPEPTYPVGDFTGTFPLDDTTSDKTVEDYTTENIIPSEVTMIKDYQTENIRITIDKVKGRAGGSRVTYYVADVWVRGTSFFKTALADESGGTGTAELPERLSRNNDAIFAVSGDYYGAREKGFCIRNGLIYRETQYYDVCVLYYNGVMETYTRDEFDYGAAKKRDIWQLWSFGPKLLDNGRIPSEYSFTSIAEKNPRCAIGYYEPGHYCFVVIDGRQDGYSHGMTFPEMSEMFYGLGCKAAYNLDGGQTAVMMFESEYVNSPYKGGRNVSDIICFGE